MKLDIKHFELIKAIQTEGSLTKAAGKLFLTQSALSHQLKDLEGRLSTKLFVRSKKKLYLTEIGKEILNTGTKVLDEVEQLEQKISNLQQGLSGTIKISTESLTTYHWVPVVLKQFIDLGHDVKIEVILAATHNPLEHLRIGKLDMAITHQKTDDSTIKFTPLFEDEYVVVVSKKHRFANREYLSPEDLAKEKIFIHDSPEESNDMARRVLMPNNVILKNLSKVGLTETILELVSANLGASIMSSWVAERYLECCCLAAIPISKKSNKRSWYLAELKKSNLKYQKLFKDFIITYFSKNNRLQCALKN